MLTLTALLESIDRYVYVKFHALKYSSNMQKHIMLFNLSDTGLSLIHGVDITMLKGFACAYVYA